MNKNKKFKKPINFCCERFEESYNDGEIHYAYEESTNMDETDWFIGELWHLYYCPFCGAFIKGRGFGNYDKKYPPKRYTRVIKQTKSKKNT